MRVPQSPKSLRRVTTLSSVRNDDDEGASSGSDEGNNRECKKTTTPTPTTSSTAANDDKPPRPTYTARIKDGKYTVGVEASLSSTSTSTSTSSSGNDNPVTIDTNDPSKSGAAHLFNRGRDRTRISAVQRLVERKLAQKEKERLKEREHERDRVTTTSSNFDWKYRSSSTSSNFARDRNFNSIGSSDDNDKGEFEKKIRNENENEYLASLMWRTSRSCSGTRRRCGLNEEEDVAKTIITIGPGKPTRIREHSPSKKSPTTELPPTSFENLNEEKPVNKVRPGPRDPSPSKVSDSLYMNSAPLKSTGLFREFTKTTTTTTTTSSTGGSGTRTGSEKRKTSFTTEKTIHLSGEHDKEKARRLSIDCNFVFVKSPTTYSTFTQSERLVSGSSTSSLSSSSFSSTSSNDSTGEKEPIRLSRLRTANFESGDNPKDKNPDFTPDPPIRERKTSRRIFIHTPYHNLNNNNSNNKNNDSCGDETSSNVSSTDEGSVNGNDSFGETYMSASSRLLYNLSSGYRQHRAAAAANRSVNINIIRTSTTTANNNNNMNNNKSFNTNEDSYPRRRFSQEHLVLQEEDSDTFGESVSIKRPIRQPVRKISLPVRPTRESTGMRHEVSSLADQKKDEGNELYKNSNYREALQRYSEAICLCPETPSYYGNRAACYMMLGQHSRALEDAKTSVQLDPLFTRGYIRIAKCCVVTGDVAGASHALDQAHKLEPNNLAVSQERTTLQTLQKHQLDSQQAISSGDRRKALYFLDRALEIATASSPVKLLRAECLAYLGRSVEAQEVANDLLRQDSTNVEAIFVRGLCLYYEDNMDKAFTHFQQVLRLAPDHERAKDAFKRAKLLRQKKEDGNNAFKAGRYSEAYDLYSEALNIDPNTKMTNAKLYFNRATVAAKIKKLQASVDDCTAALALDEKYYKAQLRRAKSYLEMERYEDAVRDLEALCRTDRTNLEYRQLLQSAKQELKKSKRKDYYKILGVERGATDEEIKRAYRKRALVHHPDRHSGSSEEERKEHEKKFKEIGEAYGVLSDAKERSRYNNGCDLDDLEGTTSGHGGFTAADLDPEQAFKNFFRAGHGHYEFNFSGPGSMPGFSFQFG